MTRGARATADPAAWGVETEYVDALGTRRTVSSGTIGAILEALGAAGSRPALSGPVVVAPGDPLPAADRIELEDGREVGAPRVCRRIPFGYHRLIPRRGDARRLIVSPRRCPAPERGWGWAAQLYAMRSASSWGMGDLGDLRRLAAWSRRQGASFVLVNPLHASLPVLPQQPSPYYPSSRVFRNPIYLYLDELPGARHDPGLGALRRQGQALNRRRLVDRDAVWRLKMRGLDRLWQRFAGDAGFDAYRSERGRELQRYASFCAIAEQRRDTWHSWPVELRNGQTSDVDPRRVAFHCWLQWLVDHQVAAANRETPLMHDLAIGVDPAGADAWLWQEAILGGVRVGAPPDEFSATGQDWGLPPFHPLRLRELDYEPFIATLRGTMRQAGAVRIDHVMGLFRLWWIPRGADARDGAYVRYPAGDLLDILALEAWRAGCHVVGEDLGTVEPGVRAELRRRGILSYRLAWFEDRPPRRYPRLSLAALTTHDLPTAAGVWVGSDLREQEKAGHAVNREAEERVAGRLQRLADLPPEAPAGRAVEAAYAAVAGGSSVLVAATLDDAALAVRRPNLPGATDRPNWSIPLPRTLEQLRRDALPRRIAAACHEAGR